jgi:hypothetical protein
VSSVSIRRRVTTVAFETRRGETERGLQSVYDDPH